MYEPYSNSGTLTLKDLAISRGDVALINGLSMTVEPGDMIWMSGSNGIGKTTLLRCIAGLIRQDSGEVKWQPDDARNFVVYQGHNDGHKRALSVRENLEFWRDLYGSDASIDNMLKRVGLLSIQDLKAQYLSAGQSRRLVLARMLIKNTPLWILDEPMAAMDQAGRDLVFDLLDEHLQRKGSIILASHGVPSRVGQNTRHLVLKKADHESD